MLISLLYMRRRALSRDCLGPFGKNRAQPKTRQKGEIFSMMRVVPRTIWFKCIVYPLTYQKKMPFYALVFTLRSKVDLICTRAIRLVIAQSVQFSKIAKKLNIDLCQFSLKCRKCAPHAFSPIIERGLGRVSKRHVRGREKKVLNNLFSFFQNLRRHITGRTKCDKDGA